MTNETVKPWIARDDRIVQFLTDNGALYASQFHNLSAVSPASCPNRLEVDAPPHGTLIVTGPAARELCASLCAGRATMIRKDGEEITAVEFVSKDEDAVEF